MMQRLRVMVLGSGGREHALCAALGKSALCEQIFCAPGNAGIALNAECLVVDVHDHVALVALCRTLQIDLVVVGPDGLLAEGVVDALQEAGIKVFGPTRAAAQIESSKAFMKDICGRAKVATAAYAVFEEIEKARAYVRKTGGPLVVKADGLTMGKGVTVCATTEEALAAVTETMEVGAYGDGGRKVLIEERMVGEEVSVFALLDGRGGVLPLMAAQDHKRAYDGDQGPNTGGMGAYSPVPWFGAAEIVQVMSDIVEPVEGALRKNGTPFCGFLYAGLMKTEQGFKVVEFNARLGDPEAQCMLPRLKTDVLEVLWAAVGDSGLSKHAPLEIDGQACVTVVMAARGYPRAVEMGSAIGVLPVIAGVQIYHAATASGEKKGTFVAQGGRVLNVAALGETMGEARQRAYRAVELVDWPEGFYRRDIGVRGE